MSKQLITLVLLVGLSLISVRLRADALNLSPTATQVDAVSLRTILGTWSTQRSIVYERMIGTRESWTLSLDSGFRMETVRSGDPPTTWDNEYTTWGLGAAFYGHFGSGADLEGWYAGPTIHVGVKTLKDSGSGSNSTGFLDVGGESGYQWVYQIGLTLNMGLMGSVHVVEPAVIDLGPTLGLGYAF
jgi:hypothetical protein